MNPKQRAAEAALEHVSSGLVIGLGTGSTADYFLVALGEALKSGRVRDVRGVPTSEQTHRRAQHLGIPLVPLERVGRVDVTIDGADEVAPNLDLIKGLGGALLREKIVAQNSGRLVIIADAGKRVSKLGEKSPVPVEVIPFAHEVQAAFLTSLGCEPKLRRKPDGSNFVTDNGNLIYDCRFPGGMADPGTLETKLATRAGVVETGLFLGIAAAAIIADDASVQTLRR
jgi:ribose 5-phosphate isomerase A